MVVNLKDLNWVKTLCQTFEAACDGIGEIVNQQNSVTYAEKRVQKVGKHMQLYCPALMQDVLPPTMGPEKRETQALDLQQIGASASYTGLIVKIKDESVGSDSEESLVEPYNSNLDSELSSTPFTSGICLNELKVALSKDSINELESSSSSTKNDDIRRYQNSVVTHTECVEEGRQFLTDRQELLSFKDNECCDTMFMHRSSNKDDEITTDSLVSVSPANSFDYEMESGYDQEEELSCPSYSTVEDINSDCQSCNRTSGFSSHIGSPEKRPAGLGILHDESFCQPEVAAVPIKPTGETDASGQNEIISHQLQFPKTSTHNGNQHTRLDSMPKILSNRISNNFSDIADSNMESIGLRDKVKIDNGGVIVDHSVPYALTCRAPKLRSYKKKIQEVFASRRRLAKEYEQLAILYGDIDVECSKTGRHTLLMSATASESEESLTHGSDDCGWELI